MKNLLYNPSFELWTYPNSAPDGWSREVGNIIKETTLVFSSSYSMKLTSTGSGESRYYQDIHESLGISFWQGRSVTFGAWVYSSNSGGARLGINDGYDEAYSSYHPGDTTWKWLTITKTINPSSSTRIRLRLRAYTGDNISYYDNLVALEGCWVPQTPYDFEDVEFRLGPTSATSIVLYPDEGMELGKYLMHNTQRAADGHLYGYEFGTYHKSSFPVQFMPSSDAAIVNSWWESQAKLLLFVTSGPVTAVHSCMIMGETCPMSQINKPYDDRFKGTIPLEGY